MKIDLREEIIKCKTEERAMEIINMITKKDNELRASLFD